ncbi:MAG: class I SAM-dependent methyltransferase [Acidobacteria bacterium]|nr:class I SAM-dependent methyltransferase [Acidobacteriota bacterium]
MRNPTGATRLESAARQQDDGRQVNRQIAKWNARYAGREPGFDESPASLLPPAVDGVNPGRALDLACGTGRNAIWLARRGWRVDAVDGAETALDLLLAGAERAGCEDRVTAHAADLESEPPGFVIAREAYDLIVDCYFIHRPLFAAVRAGTRPGGLFVAALHLPAPAGGKGHRYVLQPGELEREVKAWRWDILHSAERAARPSAGDDLGVAEIIARRPTRQPGLRL